jgi:response regulator NasT
MRIKSIIIAENESIVAMDIASILKRFGAEQVIIVHDGKTLLEKALTSSPDLIIADIYLGGKSMGTDTVEKIWEKVNVPVLFVSAVNNITRFKEKYKKMNCRFLDKPFVESDLKNAIKNLLKVVK